MNSEKLLLDLDQGFWTTTDGYKTKVHTSTNYISDDYVRLITDYENRDDEVKDYIDNLIAANPNESYITISINPTTKEIEFAFGIYNANLTNYFKYDYKFQLIKDLSKLLYNVDTIDNSTTNEYKQQIGSNFEKYKEIVDSVIVERLTDSIGDIIKDDFYTSDEEHDCRYYCEFFGEHLDLYLDADKNIDYRIGLVFNKKQECVDYFIDRIIDGNIDYDVHQELTPYNKAIFRIAEDKIKNLVLQKLHTHEFNNISKNIDWTWFSEDRFNKFKNELLTGNEKPDWKGSINVGSVSFDITQYEKTEENSWLDYKVFVLGEDNGYECDNSIPYAFYEGNQFAINMITDNTYEQFKEKFTNLIIDDLKENNIQNSELVKKEMMRPTIDWSNQEQSKQLYFEKLNGKEFFKTETLSNANELKSIINFLEPSLDFKKSDAEIVLDYLVGGDYLSFENNTLKYKGDDGKAYGENLFDVLKYIESNIEEHIENITMNIEDGFIHEEDREYLKKLKEQILPSIQNKCNFLRLKEIFKDKTYIINFDNDERIYNFEELFIYNRERLKIQNESDLIYDTAFSMVYNRLKSFGYLTPDNFDKLFDIDATNIDAKDIRCDLVDGAINKLIEGKLNSFDEIQEFVIKTSKEVFKNECLKELEKQTFLDDVEKIVDLSIDSLDKDDYLATYSSVTEEDYDRTKYLFDNFYKTENQTGSIDLNALYNSKESIDNVVTLENGAEIRKVIESDEGEEREYYDLYDKDLCSICDGENYEVKAVIDGTYYLKGLDSEYEDSGFALSTEEYLIATQRLGLLIEKQILDINVWEETYDCGCLNDEIAEKLFDNYKDAEGYNDVIHIFAEKNEDGSFEYHLDRHNPETGECKECLLDRDIPQILKDYLQKEIELFETKNKDLEQIKPQFIKNLIENNSVFDRFELTIQNDNELLKQMNLNSELLNHTFIFDITSSIGRHKELSRAFIRKELLDGTIAEENIDLDMIPPKLQDKLQDWFKKESQGRNLHIIEDVYYKLADKICQAAYEASASGFNYSFDLDEIATLADRDINWVKTHIEKIGEALVEHNDELLLDFNPNENINLEENHIDFNFCSVGEDANELFKCVEGRWQRKTNRELEADGYIIPVDIKYSFAYKPNPSVRDEQQVLVDSICDLFIEDSEIIDKKVNSLPGGKFNIEFILRHDFAIEPGTDYFNLKFDNINNRILNEMNNIIKNNEKLHCFTIDSIESFIPEEFHIRKNLVLINDETIENFSKISEEYLKELNPEMISFAGSSMWREEERFTADKNNFFEIMEKYPAIKNYVEKKWDLLKEKSLQHEKEVDVLWNKGILLFKDTKYWEDILTETPADSKENDSFILSKLHSKFRQEIVDKFNPNENINWENESWNYICETMQRKSFSHDYNVNYDNGLTSKDLQDFIACDFITIKMNLHDKEMESLWEELEDIPFIEDEDGRLILDSDEPWHNFEPGTTKEEIWHYFDRNHSKGINYLVNEYESKKDGYEEGYSEEYELNDLIQEEQEPQMYKKIHSKNSDGLEYWKEYDEKGNLIHFKNSNGYEQWTEYDDKGNVIHCKDSNRDEEWTDYDEKGNEIHYLTSDGYEYWKEYDEKGNECHFKNSDGLEEWKEYDDKGNLIHCKNSDGYEEWMEYGDKGNEIHFKDSKGWEHWKEYDDKGNEIHFKDFRGYEIWKKYNEKGNVIYCKDSNGAEYWKEYDNKGNEIHFKDSKGFERSSTVEYVSKEQYLQEQVEQTEKDGYETFKEPMQIVEEISKEEFNLEKDFRYLLLENMKTTKSPFVATHKIFEELKQKNDTERIKEFNKYLKDNNCTTKKGFEKFFIEIIGLTKKEPNKTQDKEFNESYSLKR